MQLTICSKTRYNVPTLRKKGISYLTHKKKQLKERKDGLRCRYLQTLIALRSVGFLITIMSDQPAGVDFGLVDRRWVFIWP